MQFCFAVFKAMLNKTIGTALAKNTKYAFVKFFLQSVNFWVTTLNFHIIVNSIEAGKIHAIVKYLDYFSYKLLLLFQVYFKI